MVVLIAEDDLNTRRGLAEVLQHEGFVAIQAADGSQAWDKYLEHRPDFICLDVMMPRMNGYELCRKIRQTDNETPIVFLTAKGEEIDTVVGLEIGADDYIIKPFAVKELLARFRAVARRCLAKDKLSPSKSSYEQEFRLGDLVVMPRQLRAIRADQVIDLSLREIKVLQLIFQRAGQVVDRIALMNHAWGQEYMPTSRTLDQHISQLRKKIELDPKNPSIIQTVHGVGYRYDF